MRALVIAAVLAAGTAPLVHAQSTAPPVVLVGSDPAFDVALRDLLVDQHIESVGALAVPQLGEVAARSRSVAQARSAVATVWLMPASSGATLITYDVDKDRFLVRELSYQLPLTATQAAEAARMVKTMLRALHTADTDEVGRVVTGPAAVAPPPRAALGAGIGAWFAAPQGTAAPQLMLAAAWRPEGLGAAVVGTLAPRSSLDTGAFDGDVGDIVLAATVRNSLRVAPGIRVMPGLGGSVHVVSLDGKLASGTPLTSRRFDPAARIELAAAVALPHALEAGIAVSADCLLRRQRYEVESERILLVSRVQLMTAAYVSVRL